MHELNYVWTVIGFEWFTYALLNIDYLDLLVNFLLHSIQILPHNMNICTK